MVTNSELIEAVAAANGLAKTEAKKIVDSVIGAIGDAVAKGDEVAIGGFGKFKVTQRPAREGRNPATGKSITIPASKKLSFNVAKALKDKINA